jgi:membrane protease YdiL (CAAX protease family)
MAIKIESAVIIIFLFSLFEILFLVPIILYTKYNKLNTKKYFKELIYPQYLKKKNSLVYTLFSIDIALIMIFIAPYIILFLKNSFIFFFGSEIFQQAQENLNEFTLIIQNPYEYILIFIMTFFVIGLNEEIFFRGFLLKSVELSKKYRILLSSIFFSVYHLITSFNVYSFLYMFLYYFIWGLILSIEFYACKKQLIFPVITHGLFDFLLYLIP